VGIVAAVVTASELVVAVDLVATANFGGWQNWPVGVAYIALVSVIGGRVMTGRASARKAALELLGIDLLALPVAVAVMAMSQSAGPVFRNDP
jgi:hypothetical protein